MNLETLNLHPASREELENFVPVIPDFPKPGIMFRDIMPLIAEPRAFKELIDLLAHEVKMSGADKVVGLESRGFLLGIPVAMELGLPFVAARKAGKLPGEVTSLKYSLEYGEQTLEIQKRAIAPGDRVAIIDDLLATGGTARAAGEIVESMGATVTGFFFAIELPALNGRNALQNPNVSAVMKF